MRSSDGWVSVDTVLKSQNGNLMLYGDRVDISKLITSGSAFSKLLKNRGRVNGVRLSTEQTDLPGNDFDLVEM